MRSPPLNFNSVEVSFDLSLCSPSPLVFHLPFVFILFYCLYYLVLFLFHSAFQITATTQSKTQLLTSR